ncbi:Pentatricopeptide repeat-containing protein [Apostasia shenzhenica]|uniref:Pentatricopeptide repeat-containing protein n=1 Tax=Apostasia shenzhenica TaxID=1088818 RepID=A0A2I0AEF5_9ASPA|nr:Pentatricopeptide repeat-containing protein [Apostasia shenzhenica]
MRILASFLLRKPSILHGLRRNPSFVSVFSPHTACSSRSPTRRSLHELPSNPDLSPADPLPSRILQPIPLDSPAAPPAVEQEEEDPAMNEFLSRFVWAIRGKLSEAYPDLPRDTRDAMLLVICQKVVARLDSGPGAAAGDPPVDLSEDLWKTIWEVSASVHEAMRRDRVRAELRKYLHSDEVKQMCRFAGDIGIRGDFLRELRFKWAREKLEEVEFYRELDRMREQAKKEEEMQNGSTAGSEKEKKVVPMVTALPQRRGKIKYSIFGLDMSDSKWAEVAERLEVSENHILPEVAQPVEGRSKRIEEKIMVLDANNGDLDALLEEFGEALSPKRIDWLALLDRIRERNTDLYFKAVELLLDVQTFGTNIRDYSKLVDEHFGAERIQDAERILNKMLEKGIEPDVLTSIILVRMYSKSGNLDRAKEAFEKLRQEGFQSDLRIYTSMIAAYVNAGVPKQGELLIREMEEKDIKPTRDIYMQLLQSYASRGQIDGAQRMMNMMQFAGIQPDLNSYTLLIEAYSLWGDPDQARGHFDVMLSTGIKPDDQCTANMVAAYEKKNLLDKAVDLLLKLEKDGFTPGIVTDAVLADWMARLHLVEEAEILLKKIKEKGEPPLETHVGLWDMYSRAGNKKKAHEFFKILQGRKNLLKADQFERIVRGLLDRGFLNDAKKMYDEMHERGFAPSESIKITLMAAQSMKTVPKDVTSSANDIVTGLNLKTI